MPLSGLRVGQGIDVHRFSDDPSRPLVLGGVTVPGSPGLEGHSDADVVLHALTDAALGAAGLGDLGALYGVDRPEHAGADSQVLLADALERVLQAGWLVANADVTVIAERPMLGPHRAAMEQVLARLLRTDAVSVKATTTDGLGFTGRGEGVAALAVVLLQEGLG